MILVNKTAAIASSLTSQHLVGLLRRLPHGRPPADGQQFLFRQAEAVGVAFRHLRSPAPSVASATPPPPSRIDVVLPLTGTAVLRRRNRLRRRPLLPAPAPTPPAAAQAELGRRLRHGPFYDGRPSGQERHGLADAGLERRDGGERSRSQLHRRNGRNNTDGRLIRRQPSRRRWHHHLRLKTHHQLSNRMTLISLLMPPSILLLLKRATFLKWSNYIQINFWDLNHFSTIALLLLRRNLRERTGVDWREKTKNNSVRSSPSRVYFIIGKDLNVNIKYYTGFDFYDSRWRRLLYLHTHTHTKDSR